MANAEFSRNTKQADVAPAPFVPVWAERTPEFYKLTVLPNFDFSVSMECGQYWVSLPGRSLKKCWNRKEVERVCLDFALTQMACDEPDEDQADDRAYSDRRFEDAAYRIGRTL